jgi:hypothetical protein
MHLFQMAALKAKEFKEALIFWKDRATRWELEAADSKKR